MIIGKPDVDELTDRVAAAERDLGRPLNYTILSDDELRQRRLRGDRFIASVDSGPSLTVLETCRLMSAVGLHDRRALAAAVQYPVT